MIILFLPYYVVNGRVGRGNEPIRWAHALIFNINEFIFMHIIMGSSIWLNIFVIMELDIMELC